MSTPFSLIAIKKACQAFSKLVTTKIDSNDLHFSLDLQLTRNMQFRLERTPSIDQQGQALNYRLALRSDLDEYHVILSIAVPTQRLTQLPPDIGSIQYLHNEKQNELWVSKSHRQLRLYNDMLSAFIEDKTQPQLVRVIISMFESVAKNILAKLSPAQLNQLGQYFESQIRAKKALSRKIDHTNLLLSEEGSRSYVQSHPHEFYPFVPSSHVELRSPFGLVIHLYRNSYKTSKVIISDQPLTEDMREARVAVKSADELIETLSDINAALISQSNFASFYADLKSVEQESTSASPSDISE